MRALLVYPTHENCLEVQAEATALRLSAAVYPGRCTEQTPAREGVELNDRNSVNREPTAGTERRMRRSGWGCRS